MKCRSTKVGAQIAVRWPVLCGVLLFLPTLLADDSDRVVSFNRDVRPILSDKCMFCHGPDEATREAGLRLDDEQQTHGRIVVPGKPGRSELIARITSADENEIMPPADSGRSLSKKQIGILRQWIKQGGTYEKHWSFIAPVRSELAQVKISHGTVNAIDAFVFSRLESEGLQPSKRANKHTLLRRVSLDLTGLPPTVEELDAFLADESELAYERVVDRLLSSPRYGEHMARYWLDAARYADTNGFFVDSERSMWPWRDWVINAFNSNMPFDQFTIDQLAGDLVPNSTLAQKIASGFNRNHMTTRETGAIDEEYRVEYVVDRVHTTATTWLGLTAACARCHDHKFDPISQKEFFQLFAFFNHVPENGVSRQSGNANPVLQLSSPELQQQLDAMKQKVSEIDARVAAIEPKLSATQSKWEQVSRTHPLTLPTQGLRAHFSLNGNTANDGSAASKARAVGNVEFEEGFLGQAAKFDGDAVLEFGEPLDLDCDSAFSFGGWIKPMTSGPACVLSKNDDVNSLRGFDVMVLKSKLAVHLIHEWNSNAIRVTTKNKLDSSKWQQIFVTYDGSSSAAGVKVYVDGVLQELQVVYDRLSGSIQTDQPLRIGRRSTSAAFVGLIDDVRLYEGELTAQQVRNLFTSQLIGGIVSIAPEERSAYEQKKLRKHFLATPEAAEFQEVYKQQSHLHDQYDELKASAPSMMVMQDAEQPRETFVLVRGQYDQPGEKVDAGVPSSLPPLPDAAPRNRLGLAQWLVDSKNPLTARVIVNRYWQQLFGTGLVKTTGDFGAQGEWPSHPELLDWLAVEFRESGWDTKHILKLIVMSATYQQDSRITKKGMERDPENRLLARGPRFRLDAEAVRDNALAISGLLRNRAGGPSVKPYQPAGLWEAVSYGGDLSYQPDNGEGLYRRSLYTYWKRQSPPPALLAFDAPTRETCTVNRPRTNTPLQALVLMNDVTYVEAARAMAQRIMELPSGNTADRIEFAFRLATARTPVAKETQVLQRIYEQQLKRFENNPQAALDLLSAGESQRDPSLDTAHHAAWTTVASMILNLNETITKN
ncbi:DUF1553 domain-containing protein [Fuerstiella marisgermanici]|uniref:Planctomycete cytochrome C n=1 Tax=Fuerstiella marisgermanici TaxID=1891926 RepID=A0A1P8WJL1_9PLAN|nr:DUF1553 domain-containing protein [Fuerstiella marisgermanici]APZ94254.1 Planctomycete cytochrome C [Fuerstiella marisgermanici]